MRRFLLNASLMLSALLLCVGAQTVVAGDHTAAQACLSEAPTAAAHATALHALNGDAGRNGAAAVASEWRGLAQRHGGQDWQARCLQGTFDAAVIGETCRAAQGYNAWCALAAPGALAQQGIRLTSAANVMFEDRDRICEQLAGEHAGLSAAARGHGPRAQADAEAALAEARTLAERASQVDAGQREALYTQFAAAMERHARANFEREYGPGEQGYRLLELEQAADWDACRRQSPHGAIPRWRHMDELQWCRDEFDTYQGMRTRLETESAWLTAEYAAVSAGGVPATRTQAYNSRSQAYRSLNADYGAQVAHFDRRCTGYRTSPTFAVTVCRGREDGFCQR